MEEESNNKRLLIAAGLCLLVLIAWNFIFPPPPRPKPIAGSPDGSVVATSTAAGTNPIAQTSTKGVDVAATPDVKPQQYSFKGEVPAGDDRHAIPFEVITTNVGGGIDHFELPSYKERDRDNRKTEQPITLAKSVGPGGGVYGQMAGIQFREGTTFNLPELPVYEVVEEKPDSIRYRFASKSGVTIEREYSFNREDFQIEMAVTVRNNSDAAQSHRLAIGSALPVTDAMLAGSGFLSAFVPPPDHLNGLCHSKGDVERVAITSLQKDGQQSFKEQTRWVAMDRQYFVAALIPRDGTESECTLSAQNKLARADLVLPLVTLKPGEERRHKFTAYLGVKKPALMTRVNAQLEQAVDYTILGMNLAFLCEVLLWILGTFHAWSGSWGVAILGLTVLVKLILFPLNQRAGRSTKAMSALKPKLDLIREKFPEDRQRQSEEMMKLYKEHGVSPTGGCLPVLIQMPIWFALYRSLWVSTDLYQQGFLWIPDLTARDPWWVLPVLLVVVMFLQQKMTPTTMDPTQQKIMTYTMPLIFGAMMIALPAGLCFYIFVNTVLTILQTHFINRSIGPIGGPAKSVQGATAEGPTGR
jgi:YidC/Oxa1 family membrane protein insertase